MFCDMKQELNQPAWNIESEYPSLESAQFAADETKVSNLILKIKNLVAEIAPEMGSLAPTDKSIETARQIFLTWREAEIHINNLSTWLNCVLSVDSKDEKARAKVSVIYQTHSQLAQEVKPLENFFLRCSEETFGKIFSATSMRGDEFYWRWQRRRSDTRLSNQEESLITALATPGLHAWGDLYSKLSGKLKAKVELKSGTQIMGLAEASSLKSDRDDDTRRAAWTGINEAWSEHRESAAAILNAIAGWRFELLKKRSTQAKRDLHFLDEPLHRNRITKQTLDAMLAACWRNNAQIRRCLTLMAKLRKKPKLDPWDLLGPSPIAGSQKKISFDEAAKIVCDAYSDADPEMGKFANLMLEKRWIEARVLPNKVTGGYCTGFDKSMEPRIYMTYNGTVGDMGTLAHEIGHAYHSWVIRDIPYGEQFYPSTLAETASVFGEAVLRDALFKRAQTKEEKIEFAWEDLDAAIGFLLNIPTRFEFEKSFYELRANREVSADELCDLTDKAFSKWYGANISENDKMFWASKLHFALSQSIFYNFPYTFGYLFSMSLYARRKKQGPEFMQKYVDILRDTGRMSAEDLIQKHLGEDIQKPEFWQAAIDLTVAKIDAFERLLAN